MATCRKCGKFGIFLRLNPGGYCKECEAAAAQRTHDAHIEALIERYYAPDNKSMPGRYCMICHERFFSEDSPSEKVCNSCYKQTQSKAKQFYQEIDEGIQSEDIHWLKRCLSITDILKEYERKFKVFTPGRSASETARAISQIVDELSALSASKEIGKTSNNADLKLARELFETLIVSTSSASDQVMEIVESLNNDRRSILFKVIELCGNEESSKAYSILSDAYFFLGAKYRKEAILYTQKWLNDQAYIPCVETARVQYRCSRLHVLAQCYEREYQFDNAINAYLDSIENRPEYPAAYVGIARCLIKKGEIDQAISFLEAATHSNYYVYAITGSGFNTVIDTYLSDAIAKRDRGYRYQPRKPKRNDEGES